MNNDLYIIWNEDNNLGIPIIDEQHKGLVSNINSFHYFIKEDKGLDILRPIVSALVHYIDVHFRTEEPLMYTAGYPDVDQHIRLHRLLTERTKKIAQESLNKGNAQVALDFLKDWWLNHINQEDRKYASYVKKALGIM
jgi:hemerythrin